MLVCFHSTNGLVLDCTFRTETWYHEFNYTYNRMSMDLYECVNKESEIKFVNDSEINDIKGNHVLNKNNSDVLSFNSRDKIMHYFPRNLHSFFTNLRSINIKAAKLKKISESDLQPFKDLRILYLQNNNIEIIEKDVFKHNPKLEYLALDMNSIQFVSSDAFDHLIILKTLLFRFNMCFSDYAYNDCAKVLKLVDDIKMNCLLTEKTIKETWKHLEDHEFSI